VYPLPAGSEALPKSAWPEADPTPPFFLIVADYDRGFFSVEGPMTDDRPWNDAVRHARNHQRRIVCGDRPARIATRSPPNT
jgi:hypothetical protein